MMSAAITGASHLPSVLSPVVLAQHVQAGEDRVTLLIASIFVFALAIFVGFEIINKVPATLHTPLMSGSNAISGITIVGALVAAKTVVDGSEFATPAVIIGTIAIIFAMINVVGGFAVTDRMLKMFRKR